MQFWNTKKEIDALERSEREGMSVKRALTTVIGLPLVIILLLQGNKYIFDVIIAVVAVIGMYEYAKCSKEKAKVIPWIGYVCAISIAFIHAVPETALEYIKLAILPFFFLTLFLHPILSNLKINFQDIAHTFLGIVYICGGSLFLAIIYGMETKVPGVVLIWYVMFASWATDSFAYLIGTKFGKRHFSEVSPKKSIEGCIAGTLSAILIIALFTFFINKFLGYNISYIIICIIGLILSILGQIGDLSASVIKRYLGIKDFSNLFPGHGGMLDRMDSVMFIAPFAYLLFKMFI